MKDYKKILKGVVDIISTTEKSDIGFANICTYIGENCPELKESEDERIRKRIIHWLKSYIGEEKICEFTDEEMKEGIAWLEKQKPVEPLSESVIDTEDKRMWSAISQGLSDVFEKVGWSDFGGISIEEIQEWLDKQGEQKPVEYIDSEDYGIDGLWHAQRILERTLGKVEGYQSDDGILEHKAAITAVKKLSKQKPAEWSEEDETGFNGALWCMEQARKSTKDENDMGTVWFAKKWLKSLKDRCVLQSKQEWDEEYIEELVKNYSDSLPCGDFQSYADALTDSFRKGIIAVKSLRPQNYWKPTERQMKALASTQNGTIEYAILQNLYNDLENL